MSHDHLFHPSLICHRCHRSLKNPKSQARGYGPICWEYVKVQFQVGTVKLPISKKKLRFIKKREKEQSQHKLLDHFMENKNNV